MGQCNTKSSNAGFHSQTNSAHIKKAIKSRPAQIDTKHSFLSMRTASTDSSLGSDDAGRSWTPEAGSSPETEPRECSKVQTWTNVCALLSISQITAEKLSDSSFTPYNIADVSPAALYSVVDDLQACVRILAWARKEQQTQRASTLKSFQLPEACGKTTVDAAPEPVRPQLTVFVPRSRRRSNQVITTPKIVYDPARDPHAPKAVARPSSCAPTISSKYLPAASDGCFLGVRRQPSDVLSERTPSTNLDLKFCCVCCLRKFHGEANFDQHFFCSEDEGELYDSDCEDDTLVEWL